MTLPEQDREWVLEFACMTSLGQALVPTDMITAVVGVVCYSADFAVIMSRNPIPPPSCDGGECIKLLMEQGMDEDSAIEYFEFNTIGAGMGPYTPAFVDFGDDFDV